MKPVDLKAETPNKLSRQNMISFEPARIKTSLIIQDLYFDFADHFEHAEFFHDETFTSFPQTSHPGVA